MNLTDWLILGSGVSGLALQAFAGYRVNRAVGQMIKRINEGKHWSEYQSFMELELRWVKWQRIKTAYRAADPAAPLIQVASFWGRWMFAGWAAAASALAMWALN